MSKELLTSPAETVNVVGDCHMCGKPKTITVNRVDFEDWRSRRGFVQNLFPYLSAADREFLISRTCGECWEKLFPPEKE